eukprot:c22447_g1_i1 orf=364-1857(-)
MVTQTDPILGSVAVVGAGISGLTAAYRLKAEGVAVTVFEAEDGTGGKIRSVSQGGLTWERGPNTMTESDLEVSMLIDDLQLREKQQFPEMQSSRYIVKDGKPEMLPTNLVSFLGSKLLSARSKFNVFFEPFLWRNRTAAEVERLQMDESVGDFLERHFGHEIVDYIVDPFVAGTSGSDPASISIRYSFPDLWALEQRYGSIIVGAIKSSFSRKKEKKKSSRRPFSFIGGLQTLTDSLVERIGRECLKLNTPVLSLACSQQGNPVRDSWKVSYLQKSGNRVQPYGQIFDAVIMTAPLHNFQEMKVIKDGKQYLLDLVPKVIYQPLSILVMAFETKDIKRPLQGFGVLIPSKEQANGFQTLGTIFSSSMFPDRAPPNQMVFTTFIGGSRNRDLASFSFEQLREIAMSDLHRLVGVEGQPVAVKHTFWAEAFPQYSLDYAAVVAALEKLENDLPGFFYAGNHRGGLSVAKSLASGFNVADEVVKHLKLHSGRKLYTMASQ